jgi:hypothetical protein
MSIDSHVDQGTIIDLFFPAHDPRAEAAASLWRQLDRCMNEGCATGDRTPRLSQTV